TRRSSDLAGDRCSPQGPPPKRSVYASTLYSDTCEVPIRRAGARVKYTAPLAPQAAGHEQQRRDRLAILDRAGLYAAQRLIQRQSHGFQKLVVVHCEWRGRKVFGQKQVNELRCVAWRGVLAAKRYQAARLQA